MSTHKPRKPSGRVAFDERGNASWEWHGVTGSNENDVDTERLKAIGADLSFDSVPDHSPPHDPYNRSAHPQAGQPPAKRRTLDDLRRLSEEIIAARRKRNRGPP